MLNSRNCIVIVKLSPNSDSSVTPASTDYPEPTTSKKSHISSRNSRRLEILILVGVIDQQGAVATGSEIRLQSALSRWVKIS